MGSPVSSVIVEAVLQGLQETAFRTSPPTFLAWYVEDTFTLVRRDPFGALDERLRSIFQDVKISHGTRKGLTTSLPGHHGEKDN